MRIGKIIRKSHCNDHLLHGEEYVSVYPNGTVHDWIWIKEIPLGERTFSKISAEVGQSPILIRKAYFDEFVMLKIV